MRVVVGALLLVLGCVVTASGDSGDACDVAQHLVHADASLTHVADADFNSAGENASSSAISNSSRVKKS